MQYTMRCHHGIVSTGNSPEQGCGQWDYNCETFITDSTRTDSIKATSPSASISGWSSGNFPYTNTPTYTLTIRHDSIIGYDGTTGATLTQAKDGTGATALNSPLGTSMRASRYFYLYKKADLLAAGLKAGKIVGMSFPITHIGGWMQEFRIRIRSTMSNVISDTITRDGSFVTVCTGANPTGPFYFSQPFTWADTTNLIIEICYSNPSPAQDCLVTSGDAGYPASYGSSTNESAIRFSGAEGIHISPTGFGTITNEITIGAWTFGDTAILPANSALFEGADNQGNRVINAHLPWSDGTVYWDCGNSTGYDRIQKAVSKPNIGGRWNYWAFTKNALTGQMQIFLNGQPFMSDTGKHRTIKMSQLDLGASISSVLNYYGQVSQFSVWNKALDSSSINRIMKSDITSADANYVNLVAYYKLNEGTGTTFADASKYGEQSKSFGSPVWTRVRGAEIARNFVTSPSRPNTTFFQGPAIGNLVYRDTIIDTVLNPQRAIIHYAIIGDNKLVATDTAYLWQATKTYTYDLKGKKIDSVAIPAMDTVRITTLKYWSKWPQKFELMSFVTPYGINLDLGPKGTMWEFDVTDYLTVLRGWKQLSIERGSGQEEFDLRFLFVKGKPARTVLDMQQIWPMTEEGYQNILNDFRFEPRKLYLNPNAAGFKLRSYITGHGQQGEFNTQLHHVTVNSKKYEWEVAKQCSNNPLYPQGGTWPAPRAGWCPGAPTLLTEVELTGTIKGGDSATMDYGVLTASGDSRYDPSNQLVSYGAPNFALNAGVVQIMRPTDRIEYARTNPACDLPMAIIRNNGSTPLTSLKMEYYVTGGPHRIFDWVGNLNFLGVDTVVMPVDSMGFWNAATSGTFHLDLSSPNGGKDEYDQDNHYTSNYTLPPVDTGIIVVNFRTNNTSFEDRYQIVDSKGRIIFNKDNLDDNTTYLDSLILPNGCYSLRFQDDGENGLYYWADTSQHAGAFLRLRQNTKTGKILHSFGLDFGASLAYDFAITGSSVKAAVGDAPTPVKRMSVYPNPAHSKLNVELEGYAGGMYTLEILDQVGRVLKTEMRFVDNWGRLNAVMDTHQLAPGTYILHITSKDGTAVQQFVVE